MPDNKAIHFVECPRDAMQGWPYQIPAEEKIAYLNELLRVGFHTLDCGSFVSPKAIPQMADTAEVIEKLSWDTTTKLLVIVANERGAREAIRFEKISYLGYPFSISETFQQRNTNAGMADSFIKLKEMQKMCVDAGKSLVVYLSMAFGNPYGDPYNAGVVQEWAERIADIGVKIISLADTVGVATAEQVEEVTQRAVKQLPGVEIGVHLHSEPHNWQPKLLAALSAGCNRVEGALRGIGGCPMAGNTLVGNMDSSKMIPYLQEQGRLPLINEEALKSALAMTHSIFKKS